MYHFYWHLHFHKKKEIKILTMSMTSDSDSSLSEVPYRFHPNWTPLTIQTIFCEQTTQPPELLLEYLMLLEDTEPPRPVLLEKLLNNKGDDAVPPVIIAKKLPKIITRWLQMYTCCTKYEHEVERLLLGAIKCGVTAETNAKNRPNDKGNS
jgi:hypothetical protein